MLNANVKLSKDELLVVNDMDFLLTKNKIISKVYDLFGILSQDYVRQAEASKSFLPAEVYSISPKIYKGEQYKGLPYVMLDYPRCFFKKDVFTIRSFFWWGNFFSITLHVSGTYLHLFGENIFEWIREHGSEDWYLCVNENEWEHNFEVSNYMPLDKRFTNEFFENTLRNKPFIKIAKKIPLTKWNNSIDFFNLHYNILLGALHQLPRR